MATIEEDYVLFETAKLLKEKGFQQLQNNCGYFTTEMVYSINVDDNGEHHFAHQYPAGVYNKDEYIAAPTHQMAMKWLRKVHNILLFLLPAQENGKLIYLVEVWTWNEEEGIYESTYAPMPRKEPEEALEAAIKYSLEHLI